MSEVIDECFICGDNVTEDDAYIRMNDGRVAHPMCHAVGEEPEFPGGEG